VAKQEQHLTTARLSALIDGQLSPEEQAQSETHLHDCAVCQQQLAELRQTVSLLHALPQPELPRSFTLPTTEPALAPRVPRTARPLAPVTSLPHRNGWPAYVTSAVRYASTLAAVIGIAFLLSGLFGTVIQLGGSGHTTSTDGASTPSDNKSSTTLPQNVPHVVGTEYRGMTPSPTPATKQAATGSDKSRHTPVQQNPLQSLLTLFDVSMGGTRAIIGIVLLVLGIIGFIMVRRL